MPLFLVGKYLPCMLVLSYFLLFYDRKRGKRSEVRRMVFTYLSLSFHLSTFLRWILSYFPLVWGFSFVGLDSILLPATLEEDSF